MMWKHNLWKSEYNVSILLCFLSLLFFNTVNVSIDSNPVPVICTAGIECSLSCTVNGVPSPTVSWLQNDVAVSDRYDISNSSTYDQTNSVLLIRNANLTHNGNYTCVGTNSLVANSSATSSIARLTVNCKFA